MIFDPRRLWCALVSKWINMCIGNLNYSPKELMTGLLCAWNLSPISPLILQRDAQREIKVVVDMWCRSLRNIFTTSRWHFNTDIIGPKTRPFSWYVRPLDGHLHPTEHSITEDLRRSICSNYRDSIAAVCCVTVSPSTVNSLSYYAHVSVIPRQSNHWRSCTVRITRMSGTVDSYPVLWCNYVSI